MRITQTLLLNIISLPLTLVALVLILPPYWVFKTLSFVVRSLFPENVKDKVVLITGASSGIGEHLAYAYAKRGARLALVARRTDRLLAVVNKAHELGSPDAIVITADISRQENCEKVVHETVTRFGRVDHLVNNAGISTCKFLEEYSDIQEMKSVMDINFWGTVYTTRSALGHLRESKGKIIVVSSVSTWIPSPRLGLYSGSKSALMGLFETLRLEVGSDVNITLLTLGVIESEITTIKRNSTVRDSIQVANEWWTSVMEKTRYPVEKVEVCAEAILRSVCRGDRYLTKPLWMYSTYWVKILCPELLEFIQRQWMIDFCNKYVKLT